MIRKNIWPVIVLLALCSIGIYFFITKNKSTLDSEEFNYKVSDSTLIQSITITNIKDTFSLHRDVSAWKVEGHFLADQAMLNLCFKVLRESEIQSVLSSGLADQARILLLKSPLVSIQLKDGKKIQFYILANKLAQQVWMMMKDSQRPFVVRLPSYKANFAALFYTQSIDWRENTISFDLNQTQSIAVEHTKNKTKSFTVLISRNLEILDYTNKKLQFSRDVLEQYLLGIKNITLSGFIYNQSSLDSLKKEVPYAKIVFISKKNEHKVFHFYPKKFPADLNEAYILMNNTDLAVVKYIVIDPLLPEVDYFRN